MSNQFDFVCIKKKANISYKGLCVSHDLYMKNGSKKIIGVILPTSQALLFKISERVYIEIISGSGELCIGKSSGYIKYKSGDYFKISRNSFFYIKINEITDYVFHFQ